MAPVGDLSLFKPSIGRNGENDHDFHRKPPERTHNLPQLQLGWTV
jgi:hypothetical protein